MKTTFQRGQKVNYSCMSGIPFSIEDITIELEKIRERTFVEVHVSLLPFGIALTEKEADELRIITSISSITPIEEKSMAATA